MSKVDINYLLGRHYCRWRCLPTENPCRYCCRSGLELRRPVKVRVPCCFDLLLSYGAVLRPRRMVSPSWANCTPMCSVIILFWAVVRLMTYCRAEAASYDCLAVFSYVSVRVALEALYDLTVSYKYFTIVELASEQEPLFYQVVSLFGFCYT